jgi:rhomboid protease GluP
VTEPQADASTTPKLVEKPTYLSRLRQFPGTYGLIGFTVFVFLTQLLSSQLFHLDLVLMAGAKVNEAIAVGEFWRMITPLFIHIGIWHIFVNMYSLYALGPAIERFFGTPRMLAIYLLSGFSGLVFSLSLSPSPSVGASGAVFGLLGSLGMFLFRHRSTFGQAGRIQLRQIILVVLLNLGLGLMPQIDNWGHLGGLVAGTLLTWALGPRYELSPSLEGASRLVDRHPWAQAWPSALIAALILVALTLAGIHSPFTH